MKTHFCIGDKVHVLPVFEDDDTNMIGVIVNIDESYDDEELGKDVYVKLHSGEIIDTSEGLIVKLN